ncbi:MAG: Spy/CpxP family protein refolding chaperone [Pyrinomonadaceae bacterium]
MIPRGNRRLKIWLALVGVFALGGVTGAAIDSAYRLGASAGRQEGRGARRGDRKALFEALRSDLDLNDEQAAQVRAILEESRNDFRQLRTEVRPRHDALRQKARARIRAVLTPEQQKRFDEKAAERDARRRDKDRDKDKDR